MPCAACRCVTGARSIAVGRSGGSVVTVARLVAPVVDHHTREALLDGYALLSGMCGHAARGGTRPNSTRTPVPRDGA